MDSFGLSVYGKDDQTESFAVIGYLKRHDDVISPAQDHPQATTDTQFNTFRLGH